MLDKVWQQLKEGLGFSSLLDTKAVGECFRLNKDEINHYLEMYGFQEETKSGRWKVLEGKSEYIASYIPTERKGLKHCGRLETIGYSEDGKPQYRPLWRHTLLKDLDNYI